MFSGAKKNQKIFFIIFYYATFQCGRYGVFKKISKKFFAPENIKKLTSKVAHNRPPTFFFCIGPAAKTAQKKKSRTSKSPLLQDWVFRLGLCIWSKVHSLCK